MSAEADSASPALNLEKCSVVLLDVAGTTTSINFVKETLFPYVTKQAADFLKSHWEDEIIKEAVKTLKDAELDLDGAIATVKEFTEQNSENKGVKTIQGLIYKKGYESGDLKAHIFSDVPISLENWAKSRKVAIYSTGSVDSQKLLFSHTAEGDLSSHITKYFDQSVGNKTDSNSYEKIAKELAVKLEDILFVTDNPKEAKAAKTAGMLAMLVTRDGNEAIPDEASKEFPVVSSFKDILFENPAKRKNGNETVPTEEQPPAKVAKTEVLEMQKSSGEDVPAKEPKQEEAMEVETPAEKEVEMTEETEKPTEAPTDKPTTIEKTEIDSSNNKTDVENKERDSKETTAENETPMETTDSTEDKNVKDTDEQPTKIEDKKEIIDTNSKEANEIETEAAVDKPVPVEKEKNDLTEKMDTEANITETTDSEVKTNVDDASIKKMEVVVETTETETKETNEKVDKIATQDTSKNNDCKEDDVVDKGTKNVKQTEEESVCEKKEKVVNSVEEKATKLQEDANTEVNVEVTDDKAEEKKEDKSCSTESDTKSVVNAETVPKPKETETVGIEVTENKSEESVQKDEGSVSKEQETVGEKTEASKSCLEENNTEEPVVEQGNNTEKKTDEKENKSDLANGINDKSEAVNGDAEEKQNGTKVDETENKVEEIKTKKIEEAADSTPPVSVEV